MIRLRELMRPDGTGAGICSTNPPICAAPACSRAAARGSISRSTWPISRPTGCWSRIDRPINKDTELHPLVRWQFLGGVPEDKRRAFLFTNVIDAKGRRYDMPVVVGALAASPEIYAVGMGQAVAEIGDAWMRAIADPIAPVSGHVAAVPAGGRDRR